MTRRQHRKYARRCPAVREVGRRIGHLAVCLVLGPPFLAVLGLAMWRMKC